MNRPKNLRVMAGIVALAAFVMSCTSAGPPPSGAAPPAAPLSATAQPEILTPASPVASATGAAHPSSTAAPPPGPTQPRTSPSPPPKSARTSPSSFNLGVPGGDIYDPAGLAFDSRTGLAYVLGSRTAEGGAAISVVDTRHREVLRRIPISPEPLRNGGVVLISPDGSRGYAVDAYQRTLYPFDPQTGVVGKATSDVRDAILSLDGERLFVIGDDRLGALTAADLKPLWSVKGNYGGLAVSGDRIAALQRELNPALALFDAETGTVISSAALPGPANGLAPAPDGGWAIRIAGDIGQVQRFSRDLKSMANVQVPRGADLFYDAPRQRYLLTGSRAGDEAVLVALAASDLSVLAEQPGYDLYETQHFASSPENLMVTQRSGSHLVELDRSSLASIGHTVLGVLLGDVVLEPGVALYAADDQGRVRVVGLPDGQVRASWQGRGPLAVDAANHRLYLSRPSGVVALDSRTGEELARYSQAGGPVPDPNRDLVYIVNRGVTMFDRSGKERGKLDSTFPSESGLAPNPYAFDARVNPVNGNLTVFMSNGIPGSNGRDFLRLYPPESDRALPLNSELDAPRSLVDLTFNPSSGETYASYYSRWGPGALAAFDAAGNGIWHLSGRTGGLEVDSGTGFLYATLNDSLARIRADGTLDEVYLLPKMGDHPLLDASLGRMYFLPVDGAQIAVGPISSLSPLEMRPRAVAELPAGQISSLAAVAERDGTTLYAGVGSDHFRSRVPAGTDGEGVAWQKLPAGSLPDWGWLTAAGGGALFVVGPGSWSSDGVWRSRNGGETWELANAGLTELKPSQALLALSADQAYFRGSDGGIFAWRPGAARWEKLVVPDYVRGSLGNLSLAPDGTLYLFSEGRLRRSANGGRDWRDLQSPAESGTILGFSSDFTHTKTLYGLFEPATPRLMRSRDGGESWEQIGDGVSLPGFASGFELTSQGGALYLFQAGPPARLYRSMDDGDTWLLASEAVLTGATAFALAPDGRLWLGGERGVRPLDAGTLAWSAAGGVPAASRTPPAKPPERATPGPTPCSRHMSDADALLAQDNPSLGCPISEPRALPAARQSFERGQMIWLGAPARTGWEERTVLVLEAGGGWTRFADLWKEGQLEPEGLSAPAGKQAPVRGFGKVWSERLGGAKSAIGWALQPEQGLECSVQTWDGGLVLSFGGEQLVLLDGGRWR